MNFVKSLLLLSCLTTTVLAQAQTDYEEHPLAAAFTEKMVSQHGFDKTTLVTIIKQAERKQSILDAISRPAEKTKSWKDYRNIFISAKRINKGIAFYQKHQQLLSKVEQEFGVDWPVIVAILGVETRYGEITGSFRVVDALATLGFDYPPRGKFFRGQLEQFLIMCQEQGFEPLSLKGSYAGAMGWGQFIPSSYRNFAVDFDGDKTADIWNNEADALASIANYFAKHRWIMNQPVAAKVEFVGDYDDAWNKRNEKPKTLLSEWQQRGVKGIPEDWSKDQGATLMRFEAKGGIEYWLGLNNFYSITRYNHSNLYAMAVNELAEAIKAGVEREQALLNAKQ